MTTHNSLAPQVKDLLSTLSEHGGQHLNELETDLVQTNVLLTEAIDKLSASFMAIHAAVTRAAAVGRCFAEQRCDIAGRCGRVARKAQLIDLHVNAAVTGLQFQDMTNQLIGRTMRRVVGFRDVLEILGTGAAAIATDANNDTMIAALGKIGETLKAENAMLENELWKAVRQTHMESGDIELF
jgi:hypothetical protein